MILRQLLTLIPNSRTVLFSFRKNALVSIVNSKYNLSKPCAVCGQVSWCRNYASKKKERVLSTRPKPFKGEVVKVWKGMTVKELANTAQKSTDDVFEAMLYVDNCDSYDHISSEINNLDIIESILQKLGKRSVKIKNPKLIISDLDKEVNRDATKRPPPDPSQLVKRPPVVTIMGHVDHGKTTLLDNLRHSSVVEQEFGGITQHIGAFLVKVEGNDSICFLDTPGHAAFSAMRARGASATDIVVLVVAADDGVMEQTIQSIKYAKAANVPIIVAINKMDKANADPERVKNELVVHGVQVEDKGGDIQAVPISARTGNNVSSLVESILTLAEVLEVKGDPKSLVEGVIIEACVDPGRGKVATVLVQRGTLTRGNYLVVGSTWAKVRAMFNDCGQPLTSAPPGWPVQVIGWRDNLPCAGDIVLQVESESRANEVMRWRREREQEEQALASLPAIRKREEDHLAFYKERLKKRREEGWLTYRKMKLRPTVAVQDDTPACYITIKGDVDGSVDAILDMIETYNDHDKCRLDLVHYGVGKVTPADLALSESFQALIYTFNVGLLPEVATEISNKKHIKVKHFNVIYKLFDDLKEEINSRILPLDVEEIIGEAKVLQEFKVSDKRAKVPVAGCFCTKGQLKKTEKYRVLRNDEVIHEGLLSSMYHLKNEVESVKVNVECGLKFVDKDVNFEPGDIIHCYHMVKQKQYTNWDPGF